MEPAEAGERSPQPRPYTPSCDATEGATDTEPVRLHLGPEARALERSTRETNARGRRGERSLATADEADGVPAATTPGDAREEPGGRADDLPERRDRSPARRNGRGNDGEGDDEREAADSASAVGGEAGPYRPSRRRDGGKGDLLRYLYLTCSTDGIADKIPGEISDGISDGIADDKVPDGIADGIADGEGPASDAVGAAPRGERDGPHRVDGGAVAGSDAPGDEAWERREAAMGSVLLLEGAEFKEEWQDEDFPMPLPEDGDMEDGYPLEPQGSSPEGDYGGSDGGAAGSRGGGGGASSRRRKLQAPDISLSLDRSEGSLLSDDGGIDTPDDLDFDVDGMDTPDEADSIEYTPGNELEWEDDTPIKGRGAGGERAPAGLADGAEGDEATPGGAGASMWRSVVIGEQEYRIDMAAIEPYRRVLSHGGYYGEGLNAIIVFAACYMPDSRQPNYSYIMENLFLYVINTLELLVADDYMIVYLNGATPHRRMPGLGWLKRCYTMIDRRLRKNLKSLVIVHPSWFIRTVLAFSRPFISTKFSSKVRYVHSLVELAQILPMEHIHIPDGVMQREEARFRRRKRRLEEELREASETMRLRQELEAVAEEESRESEASTSQ